MKTKNKPVRRIFLTDSGRKTCVRGLEAAVRSIICMNLSKSSGNCIQQENFLTRVSPLGNYKALKSPDSTFPLLETDDEEELPTNLHSMSDFVANIVAYLAGFVGKKILQKLACGLCSSSLSPPNEAILGSDYMFLNIKNNC